MWITLLTAAIRAVSDSLLSGLFNLIQAEMQQRALVQQGRAQQHAADLTATVTEAKDAATVQEDVARDSDAALDAGLERVRDGAAARHG